MIKKKYVFLGDDDSINIELINKSFDKLCSKVQYILIGSKEILKNQLSIIKSKIIIKEIINPFDFSSCESDKLNIFNIHDKSSKIKSLINQINISNMLGNITKHDVVTMPINKYVFKKEFNFTGMTEYLGQLNNKLTIMLMVGDKFSIIPITTHININQITNNYIKKLNDFFLLYKKISKSSNYLKEFNNFIFLCCNPHCGENGLMGNQDIILKKFIKTNFKKKSKLVSADSAFNAIAEKSLYFSLYHDQALIPFKIINNKMFNLTLGLNYRRLSPAHGTAKDIKFNNKGNNTSYIKCMLD